MRRQVEQLLGHAGKKQILPDPEYGPERVGDLRSNLLDASRASDILAWKATHSFDEGLKATVQWFFDQKN